MLALESRALGVMRALLGAGTLLAMTACGGGGSSGTNPVPNYGYCGNDTQYQLARPQSGATISTGSQPFEIVANGNNNQIFQSYQNFQLVLVPQNNSSAGVQTANLTQSSDPRGYQPFGSDYYYSGQLQTNLQSGQIYNVFLNSNTSNCTPIGPLGQLYT